ncbi:unnamed protein product [Prorocentrum cordatum]|uniref:Uncharacterized protein n=1 Tax=Prorocentrum cordatum TaxID=2364126 RepID=A0ABN9TST8_9DINO|nr:unnamed protein product [Polarella glacialis]
MEVLVSETRRVWIPDHPTLAYSPGRVSETCEDGRLLVVDDSGEQFHIPQDAAESVDPACLRGVEARVGAVLAFDTVASRPYRDVDPDPAVFRRGADVRLQLNSPELQRQPPERTEPQAKVNMYEQPINIYTDIGDTELVESTRVRLEAVRLHPPPATAHMQCSQELERVQEQISAAKGDVESLEQTLAKVLSYLEAKQQEEALLSKESFGKMNAIYRQTMAAQIPKARDPALAADDAPAPQLTEPLGGQDLPTAPAPSGRRLMREKADVEKLHRSFFQDGDASEVRKGWLRWSRISMTPSIDGLMEATLHAQWVEQDAFDERVDVRWAPETRSQIVLAEEIRHHDWECEALSTWASTLMWSAMLVPGAPTEGELPSAGLGIFVREGVGLHGPEYFDGSLMARESTLNTTMSSGGELVPHRPQHAVAEVPGWPPINIFGLHLRAGEGMSVKNVQICLNVGLAIAEQQCPSLTGSGWNMPAAEVEASLFTVHPQASFLAPKAIACRTAPPNAILD